MAKRKYYKFELVLEFTDVVSGRSADEAKRFGLETLQEMISDGLWPDDDMKLSVKRISKKNADKLGFSISEDMEEFDDDTKPVVITRPSSVEVKVGSAIEWKK